MKAMVRDSYGSPDVLQLREVERPALKPDHVLVRVHAASINDWDWGMLRGTPENRVLGGLFTPRARILGCDVAGRVEAVGSGVAVFRAGDEVYGDLSAAGFGAFAEYVSAPAACFGPKPPSMSFEEAAAIPQAGMLALQGLVDVGRIRSGQKVLLNGAGGGVGTFALQIGKLYGAEVTAVDKAVKLEVLQALGADHLIDYQEQDFTTSEERYDLILDVRTDRSPFVYARVLSPGGTYATVGGRLSRLLQVQVSSPLIARAQHKRVRVVALKPNKGLSTMNELFEAGKLKPVMEGPYELADLAEAFRFFASGDHRGKIIISIA